MILAHVRLSPDGDRSSCAIYARDPAWPFAAKPRYARVDRGLHVVPERLSVLTEVPCRSCGGVIGE